MAEKRNKSEEERVLQQIRYDRQMKRKRMYEQIKRARKSKIVDASKETPNERA